MAASIILPMGSPENYWESIRKDIPYKYMWAQYVTRQKLAEDWHSLPGGDSGPSIAVPAAGTDLPEIPKKLDSRLIGAAPPSPSKLKIGIVGAGSAGLFAGMILDFLNENVKDLNIDYDILEANGAERVGGRLYTYQFKQKEDPPLLHQYYDVGAMRFPGPKDEHGKWTGVMKRTFDLFDHLKMSPIKYYIRDEKHQPSYYNDIQHFGKVNYSPENADPFKLNAGLPDDGKIDETLMAKGPDNVISEVLKDYVAKLKNDIDTGKEDGWKALMAADFRSTRNFLCYPNNFPKEPKDFSIYNGLDYNANTATWLETFEYGTGWYDQSLAETVLENLDFNWPGMNPDEDWYCIEGGAQTLARLMQEKLKNKPTYKKAVTKIEVLPGVVADNMEVTCEDGSKEKYYAVFNSTTLGAMQRMDLTGAGLTYGTKQAIRCLGYGASCKVAMRFSRAWWMDKPYNIKGGLGHTDMPLRVCVYPSYNLNDDKEKPAVLLCSYSWAQDAQRLGALISPQSPQDEGELKELLLRNLARLHTPTDPKVKGYPTYEKTYETIKALLVDHHAVDWYADPYMSGAFAYFGPSQFSNMWPEICRPNGKLWIIGEAASAHHAWVVGALESSVRAVYQMLWQLKKVTGNPAYEEALELLKDKDNAPFGPLPQYMEKEATKQDALLGLVENKVEVGLATTSVR